MNIPRLFLCLIALAMIWGCGGSQAPQSRPSPPKPIATTAQVPTAGGSAQERLEFFPTANRARENIGTLITLSESRLDATITALSDELITTSENSEMTGLQSQEETTFKDLIFDLDAFIGYLPTDSKSYAATTKGRINLEAKYSSYSFSISGITTRPYQIDYNCNWLQILDAIMDPIHTSFLHSTISGAQFSKGLGEIGELEVYERGIQFLGSNTRRVNDYVWVRVNELILPNFTQAGAAFAADGTKTKLFGRSSFTRWVVPIDDTHSMSLAWGNFGERGDPIEYNTKEGCELIEQGELVDRSWKEKQSRPSDAEAVEGMGEISKHKGEHLMPTDKGIMLYRRKIRKLIKDLENREKIPQPQQIPGEAVRTNGQDTVLKIPQKQTNDRKYIRSIGSEVMKMQFEAEKISLDKRDNYIMDKLNIMEQNI